MADFLNAAVIGIFAVFGLVAVVGGARELGQQGDASEEFAGPGDDTGSIDEGSPDLPVVADVPEPSLPRLPSGQDDIRDGGRDSSAPAEDKKGKDKRGDRDDDRKERDRDHEKRDREDEKRDRDDPKRDRDDDRRDRHDGKDGERDGRHGGDEDDG